MSKLLVILITCAILNSCAIPTVYKVKSDGYADIECIRTNIKYYITRIVDTCPLFSANPKPVTDTWEIYVLDDHGTENIKLDDKYAHKLERKSCDLPTRVSEYEIIPAGTNLQLQRIVTRSDTVAWNRMFLYGEYKNLKEEKTKWKYERGNNKEEDIKKRILQEFNICSTN